MAFEKIFVHICTFSTGVFYRVALRIFYIQMMEAILLADF